MSGLYSVSQPLLLYCLEYLSFFDFFLPCLLTLLEVVHTISLAVLVHLELNETEALPSLVVFRERQRVHHVKHTCTCTYPTTPSPVILDN